MTTKDTEGKADKTRSGPATGYATDDYDQVLRPDGSVVGECWTGGDAAKIAEELNLLHACAVRHANKAATAGHLEHDLRGWRKRAEDAERAWLELRAEVARLKSHNDKLSGRAHGNEPNV